MEAYVAEKKQSSSMLAPGFRFHPTDEELVRYYLRRKVCGKGFRFDAISDIDIYKAEPWDLPSFSKLRTRDLEWYFFSALDKKYGNGSKTNRATERGYWKTTGKDRSVYHKSQVVGMKKTLVYHNGRAPKGLRTNWVMHEYRLTDLDVERAGIAQDAFVLCRVFQKSGSGPKNGERYGAPFVEEEWEDDELVPKIENADTVDFDGEFYLDARDLEQICGENELLDSSPPPSNITPDDGSFAEETSEYVNDSGKLFLNGNGESYELQPVNVENMADFAAHFDMNARVVKREFIGESSEPVNSDEFDFLLDEPFLDSCNELQYGEEFTEGNNVHNPSGYSSSDLGMIEEYLTYFDAPDENSESFAFDPSSVAFNREELVPEQMLLPPEEPNGGKEHSSHPNEGLDDHHSNAARTSDKLDSAVHGSDFLSPFVKHSSKMLGSLPAPPAFASELTPKDAAALRLHSLYQSSSSSDVAAAMIQISDITVDGYAADQFLGKQDNVNVFISFGFSRENDGSATIESSLRIHPGKTIAAILRSSFSFACLWVLLLSISFKLGIWICAK